MYVYFIKVCKFLLNLCHISVHESSFKEKNMISENLDKVTWMEAVSKCAEKNQTLAYHPDSYNRFLRSRDDHWIGIRQYYQTASEKGDSLYCFINYIFSIKRKFKCNTYILTFIWIISIEALKHFVWITKQLEQTCTEYNHVKYDLEKDRLMGDALI